MPTRPSSSISFWSDSHQTTPAELQFEIFRQTSLAKAILKIWIPSFFISGPMTTLCNALPYNIRAIDNLDTFKCVLTTHLFRDCELRTLPLILEQITMFINMMCYTNMCILLLYINTVLWGSHSSTGLEFKHIAGL